MIITVLCNIYERPMAKVVVCGLDTYLPLWLWDITEELGNMDEASLFQTLY